MAPATGTRDKNDVRPGRGAGKPTRHANLLIGLGAMHRLADVMREIKSVSSRWVHEEMGQRAFAWQEGYGAFTVGSPHCPAVRDDIAR